MDHLIAVERPELELIKKEKKENLPSEAVSVDHKVKMKESKKIDNELYLA